MTNHITYKYKLSIYILIIFAIILNSLDFKTEMANYLFPSIDNIFIYFFAIHYKVISIWFIILISIYKSSIGSDLIFANIISYIIALYISSINSKNFTKEDNILKNFTLFIITYNLINYNINIIFYYKLLPISGMIINIISTCFLYLFFYKLLNKIYYKLDGS